MSFREMADDFDLPARDRGQARPTAERIAAASVLRHRIRRLPRRLAYLDSTFPWARSGFRYHEAMAILDAVPDAMFFSTWAMTDPFPAPVHPLAEFPSIALREGITDIYGVFALFLEGLVGMHPTDCSDPHFMEGLDLGAFLRRAGIRVHGSIYPGGGLTVTPEGLERIRRLERRMTTTFSYVREVIEAVPGVVPVAQAFTETRFYAHSDHRWRSPERLVCMFAADAPRRKGLDVALEAFSALSAERFHLHVVGPHLHRRHELSSEVATFHGWLSPERLRALHREVHAFLSPVSAEIPGPGFQGVTDGFPTQAAADAMSSGCLLISANPEGDRRVLEADVHYLECDPTPDSLRIMLRKYGDEWGRMRAIADAGSARVRERMDVRRGIAEKLEHMGITAREPDPAPTRAGGHWSAD